MQLGRAQQGAGAQRRARLLSINRYYPHLRPKTADAGDGGHDDDLGGGMG